MRAALDTDLPEFDSAAAGDDAAGGDGILFVNEGVEVDAPAAAAAAAARPRPSSAGKPLGTAAPAKGGGYKAFRLPQNGGALSAECVSSSTGVFAAELVAAHLVDRPLSIADEGELEGGRAPASLRRACRPSEEVEAAEAGGGGGRPGSRPGIDDRCARGRRAGREARARRRRRGEGRRRRGSRCEQLRFIR